MHKAYHLNKVTGKRCTFWQASSDVREVEDSSIPFEHLRGANLSHPPKESIANYMKTM